MSYFLLQVEKGLNTALVYAVVGLAAAAALVILTRPKK